LEIITHHIEAPRERGELSTYLWDGQSDFDGHRRTGDRSLKAGVSDSSVGHDKKTFPFNKHLTASLDLSSGYLFEQATGGFFEGNEDYQVGTTYLDYNQFEGTAASGRDAADSTAAAQSLYCILLQPKTTVGHAGHGPDELAFWEVNSSFERLET